MTTAPPHRRSNDGSSAAAAADYLRSRLGDETPVAALILGSGLGGLADRIADAVRVRYADIPGFPSATVAGHAGVLTAGMLAGRRVLALAGRFHMYEGHPASLAGLPVRVLAALGAKTLIVSNAAGGLRSTLEPGDLMLIRDHINFMFRNPLIGPCDHGDVRFPDMSSPYDQPLCALALDVARKEKIALTEGVYCGLLGPSYETPAEVRMLSLLGADAVGMSTVPEVIVSAALGMRTLGISCVTNMACGLSAAPITHAEVIETTARVAAKFERLVGGVVARL
ncbi:MAG TPA: purine-nucleoside phosphorylase [Gemmatimonadaceae bacterium]